MNTDNAGLDRGGEIAWADDPLWFKDAIIYELHVKAFGDASGDGMGDFRGLTQRLEYLRDLGVNTLWLLPFYPSPLKDDGYDIADYRSVNPDYGSLREARAFIRAAHGMGLKVITELVVNHTSDQHPWFQAARRAPPGSRKRDFYVWSDTDQRLAGTRIIFTDTETSNWAWDPVAKAYYWHRFFSHQPDLNHNNPAVVQAVIRVMQFWLDMGVDGLRLDAIPYLCVREGTDNENLPETHAVLQRIRAAVDARYPNRMLLAEANQWPEDVRAYFGDGDECHMAYHFPLMPRMYMAIAQEDRHPVVDIMDQTPDIPDSCQWAIFLRNHDELTLEMVTDRERDYMYRMYATDPRMRVNVGIRRRLAPLMDNDMDKIRLMNSLLMSMPGSPIIYYGDEIGMGDNIYLGDRDGVRTPMQWSPDRNAGFSRADPQKLYLPPIMDPIYGYEAVNVESQARTPNSLLNWMKRLIAVRKGHKAFGRGRLRFLHPGNRRILAYLREYGDEHILCVANLSRSSQPVELDLHDWRGLVPVEMLGHTAFPPIGDLPYLLTLPRYGFYWFRLTDSAQVPDWHEEHLPATEPPVLVLAQGWADFGTGSHSDIAHRLHQRLESQILPAFLSSRRWFAGKDQASGSYRLQPWGQIGRAPRDFLLAGLDSEMRGGEVHQYFLPLALAWEDEADEHARGHGAGLVARARQRARIGNLFDAFADDGFCRLLVELIGRGGSEALGAGRLHFQPTAAYAEWATGLDQLELQRRPDDSSNTGIAFGDRLFLKGYRRLRAGISPELEIGRYLTEHTGFRNIVPMLGAIEYEAPDGDRYSLAILQGYARHQGDGWSHTLHALGRYLEDAALAGAAPAAESPDYSLNLMLMDRLGQRTGELHVALAGARDDPAFVPEPVTPEILDQWGQHVTEEAEATAHLLERSEAGLPEALQAEARRVRAGLPTLVARRLRGLPADCRGLLRIRTHGDYHLGQVLLTENDFVISDFEGEPARSLAQRRARQSPLRDLAGMLRSLDYAAGTALGSVQAQFPEHPDTLRQAARAWRDAAGGALLRGYASATAGTAVAFDAESRSHGLLDLFLLEKTLYELRYELANRPDWVRLPLHALSEFIAPETS